MKWELILCGAICEILVIIFVIVLGYKLNGSSKRSKDENEDEHGTF